MDSFEELTGSLSRTSDKIRALDAAGWRRADIARALGIRFQHVRGTLEPKAISRVANTDLPRDQSKRLVTSVRMPVRDWTGEMLIASGFVTIGYCIAAGTNGFAYSAKAPSVPGVYAFLVDDVVRYVGLTRGRLSTRLGHYVYGHSGQRTSFRIKALIVEALENGRLVEVLIATPPDFDWNGLRVDGASGLETGLIRTINPVWNQQGHDMTRTLPATPRAPAIPPAT